MSWGTAPLGRNDVATFTTSTLALCAHTIVALYGGDINFTGSSSTTCTQTVTQASTTTTVSSSSNPSGSGQQVTFTATVATSAPGSGTPTGLVTFLDGTSPLATVMLQGPELVVHEPVVRGDCHLHHQFPELRRPPLHDHGSLRR